MQSTIPPNTRREFEWLLGLGAEGLVVASAGGLTLLDLAQRPWPWSTKIPLLAVTGLVTAALAWGKWPPDPTGDRLTTWIQRLFTYLFEEAADKRPVLPFPAEAAPHPARRARRGAAPSTAASAPAPPADAAAPPSA